MHAPGALRFQSIVLEHVPVEPLERDRFQKPGRHDAVGIDVFAAHWQRTPLDDLNLVCAHYRTPAGMSSSSSRTSLTTPVIAAAATIAGLINSVRPVGLPCRPLKLRFEDAAHTWLPSSLSGFIPRHMEQPASRHSNPASRNVASRPSRSAAFCTETDPGTTSALTPFAMRWPRTIRAASRKSDNRPLVQEPMNATSTLIPAIGWPAVSPMYPRASAIDC